MTTMPSTPHRRSFAPLALAAGLALFASLHLAAQQPAASPAPGSGLKITLKWTTASEVDNYGYFVHRGDSIDGPFKQMNEKAIPGAGNSDVPSHYVWEDHDVELGHTYYYWLESVSVQGTKEKFSPVLSRTCCGALPQASPTPAPAGTPQPSPSPAAH